MKRLDFVLDEFLRMAWVSKSAEAYWSHVLTGLSNFYLQLERELVRAKLKPAVIQHCNPEQLADFTRLWNKAGKSVAVLERVKVVDGYRSSNVPLAPTDPWTYKVVMGEKLATEEIISAYEKGSNDWIGAMLGYPSCCISFFQKYWIEEKWIDTTFPMSKDWRGGFVHPANNILLRWAGIRLVSHLPCSLTCDRTRQIGQINIDHARALGYKQQIDDVLEILSWPVEWSSLHGVAVITTPVFKIVTRSDALSSTHVVQIQGDCYPREAASGHMFPFRNQRMWTENGFSSMENMEKAHNDVVAFILPLRPQSIIDFGCGNMRLMNVFSRLLHARVAGVDLDASKHPTYVGNIFDCRFEEDYDLAFISANRFFEQADRVADWIKYIKPKIKYLVVNSYNEPLDPGLISIDASIMRSDSHHILYNLRP